MTRNHPHFQAYWRDKARAYRAAGYKPSAIRDLFVRESDGDTIPALDTIKGWLRGYDWEASVGSDLWDFDAASPYERRLMSWAFFGVDDFWPTVEEARSFIALASLEHDFRPSELWGAARYLLIEPDESERRRFIGRLLRFRAETAA